MKKKYWIALVGCDVGYACQAITNNLPPLLFVIFQDQFYFSTAQISLMIICNFAIQIIIDGVCAGIIERVGYKPAFITANILCAAGIASLGLFPFVMPSPIIGVLLSIVLYACGGGAIEVLVTPIVNALPTKDSARILCLTHSFYCWGHVLVVLLSTAFFSSLGIANWRRLPVLWSILPLMNGLAFFKAETPHLMPQKGNDSHSEQFSSLGLTAVLFLMMLCAGASEVSMAEWSSYFAERGLGVTKTVGDILGPCLFAFLMGGARVVYGLWGSKLSPVKVVLFSATGCIGTYLIAGACSTPMVALVSCGITGFFVGPLWPGTLQMAAKIFRGGNTRLFAFMALFGDLGCGAGPAVVGFVSGIRSGSLAEGLLVATIFPGVLMLTAFLECRASKPNKNMERNES